MKSLNFAIVVLTLAITACSSPQVMVDVTSNPSGAVIYFGESPGSLKKLTTNFKESVTPSQVVFTKPSGDIKNICLRVYREGFEYPSAKCFLDALDEGIAHFDLIKVNKNEIDYGKYPDDYKEIISSHFSYKLLDPESARYEFDLPPSKISGLDCVPSAKENYLEAFTARQGCFRFMFTVNAKNNFGGYTGKKVGSITIRNGLVLNGMIVD